MHQIWYALYNTFTEDTCPSKHFDASNLVRSLQYIHSGHMSQQTLWCIKSGTLFTIHSQWTHVPANTLMHQIWYALYNTFTEDTCPSKHFDASNLVRSLQYIHSGHMSQQTLWCIKSGTLFTIHSQRTHVPANTLMHQIWYALYNTFTVDTCPSKHIMAVQRRIYVDATSKDVASISI